MIELDDSMMKLESEFSSVLIELNEVNDENFYTKFDRINFLQNSISNDRNLIISQFDNEDLLEYNHKFDILIKQITKKFDNMLSERRNRQKEISKKLNSLLNHKRLVNYQR